MSMNDKDAGFCSFPISYSVAFGIRHWQLPLNCLATYLKEGIYLCINYIKKILGVPGVCGGRSKCGITKGRIWNNILYLSRSKD